jgi:hypothetical protein
LQPWDTLDESYKQSNRHQADHIGTKLRAIQCGLKPWIAHSEQDFSFTESEIEIMARLEHERWMKEKQAQGWQYGKTRNDEEKIHPDLVPWESLSEEAKKKNKESVEQIPHLLARAGFQIYRIPKQ